MRLIIFLGFISCLVISIKILFYGISCIFCKEPVTVKTEKVDKKYIKYTYKYNKTKITGSPIPFMFNDYTVPDKIEGYINPKNPNKFNVKHSWIIQNIKNAKISLVIHICVRLFLFSGFLILSMILLRSLL